MSEAAQPSDWRRPLVPLAEPVEQWLQWEEQANLIGFRTSTQPVELSVSAVPRDLVSVGVASHAPASVVGRFLKGDRVLFPKHPLNRDPSVAFFGAPVVEHWLCRYTSSRTLVAQVRPGQALFSLKLPTDHPHPDWHQPEKTRMRDEAAWGLAWVELADRIDELLGPDPRIRLVREVLIILVPEAEAACIVRDLRTFQDGHHYLPGLSLPWVGRQIAHRCGEPFADFWGRHWAEAVGRAKAALLLRYGFWYETPNPQNIQLQLDAQLRPTGVVVFRDLTDLECATDAPACLELPWRTFSGPLRPETRTSFWAFDEAGDHSVDAATVEGWCERHDRAYFAELARWLPALAPSEAAAPEARTPHWQQALASPEGVRAMSAAFAALRAGRGPGDQA
jgi:hypothetical protein